MTLKGNHTKTCGWIIFWYISLDWLPYNTFSNTPQSGEAPNDENNVEMTEDVIEVGNDDVFSTESSANEQDNDNDQDEDNSACSREFRPGISQEFSGGKSRLDQE